MRGMNKFLGRALCFVLGAHKWRRYGKRDIGRADCMDSETYRHGRVCARCGATKIVKQRNRKIT
jgi:hypothetical protein